MSQFKAKAIANDKVAPSFEHGNGEQSINDERPEEWKKVKQSNARPSSVRASQGNARPMPEQAANEFYRPSTVCGP